MRLRHFLSVLAALAAFRGGAAEPARAEGLSLPPAPSAILMAPADAGQKAEPKRPTEDEMAPPEEPQANPPAEAAQTAPAPSAPAPSHERIEYTVAAGDTLGGIAYRHGVTVAALCSANGIGRDATLRLGQKLVIPPEGETVHAPAQVHVVASGNTPAGIAKRYGITVEALLEANHLRRTERLRIGQRLVIPGAGVGRLHPLPEDAKEPPAASNEMQRLPIAGSGPAFYYEPTGPGRLHMRPVIVYLHGRGADPASYCRRWARVARNLGWLVCPSGPEDRGEGKRGWNNNWPEGHGVVMRAIQALRTKYGRRVQLYGNTLIGFSEGAYVAMNVGLREPKTFNRWLILGADTDYWGASGLATLPEARGRVRRVYLITGQHDDVVDDASAVRKWLVQAGVPVRVSTPRDMGHEVALEAKPAMYQAALRWLSEG